MSNTQIQKLVTDFVSQIEGVIRQQTISSLQAALGGALGAAAPSTAKKIGKSSKPDPRAAKPAKAAKGKRTRTSPAELAQNVGRLVAFVKANPGATSEKTRAALGFQKNVWLKTFRQGVDSKQLTTKGQKRATTLYPVKG